MKRKTLQLKPMKEGLASSYVQEMDVAEGGNMTGKKKSVIAETTKPAGPAGYARLHSWSIPQTLSAISSLTNKIPCPGISESVIRKSHISNAKRMHFYLNYAREHWTREGENPPAGLILCTRKDNSVVHYALEGLPNKVLAVKYRTVLPDVDKIAAELTKARLALEARRKGVREDQP